MSNESEAGLRPDPLTEAKEALEQVWAAIGDRLLGNGPLSQEYAHGVAKKVNAALAGLRGEQSQRRDWQAMVREFHVALNHGIGDTPRVRNAALRAALIAEEAGETVAALEAGDLVGVIDGLCDVIYVALGCAIECGIDLAPFFAEVHRSNMAKMGGPLREDGKRLKPPGWKPPDIAGLLSGLRTTPADGKEGYCPVTGCPHGPHRHDPSAPKKDP